MDAAIWWLHDALARAAAEYASTHPDNAGMANALPALWLIVSYAWIALTLWLGVQRQMLYFRGISPAHAHLAALKAEVDAASSYDPRALRNAPEQHADGKWYRNKYDPDTGEKTGTVACEPPAHTQPIGVVTGGSRFTLRRS